MANCGKLQVEGNRMTGIINFQKEINGKGLGCLRFVPEVRSREMS